METDEDVDEDGDEGEYHTDDGSVGDVLGHRRSYLGTADDGTAGSHIRILEHLDTLLCHQSGS